MLRTNIILPVLTMSFGCPLARAQEAKLTVPAYHNLPTTEGYFQGAGGVRLFYRVAGGNGDPIVFLHGGPGGSINIGGYDLEPLAQRGHRLLMFDERGAGRSGIISDPSKLQIEDFVQDVEEFRKKFGLDKMGIIGLSWGSLVALKYTTMYPQCVSRVVFLSPMSPTIALWDERVKHLDSLETEVEREEEKQAREKLKAAEGAEVIAACEQMFDESHRLYVRDVDHFRNARAKA